ncbi:hypothetical protein KY366_02915 [Candidatus Woesearchaeota archaeon]|nr:hypothetical protein [Candidatus Woesearchaeota archaeon]
MIKKLNPIISMHVPPVYKTDHPVMSLSVLRYPKGFKGVAREIIKRKGNPGIEGFVDRSKLFILESKDGLNWKRKKELKIRGINKIINEVNKRDMEFIGLEDPTICIDSKKTIHLYFTIAYRLIKQKGFGIFLGHAEGKSIWALNATKPVLSPVKKNRIWSAGFKELTISPKRYVFGRINLVEKGYGLGNTSIDAALVKDGGKDWKPIKTVADPGKMKYSWVKGGLSPGPILNPKFITHKNLLVGILNGRSPPRTVKNKKIYGKFCGGIFLFNPKTGDIPWISPKPLIDDPEAKSITFVSDVIEKDKEKALVFAHIDDSFIRAYEIDNNNLKKMLPDKTE